MFFYTDEFVLPLPDGHQFPMDRYRLLRERIIQQGIAHPGQLRVPEAASREQLLRVHCPDYVGRVFTGTLSREEQRRIGFPWTPQMVERSRRSVGATIQAALVAIESGFAANLAGGTHHASYDRGSGYCVFNDVVVTIAELRQRGMIQRAVVIDGDVHQGDGTALLCQNDSDVFTFSIHAQKAFPARKQQSDLDIALAPQTGDVEYLDAARVVGNDGEVLIERDIETESRGVKAVDELWLCRVVDIHDDEPVFRSRHKSHPVSHDNAVEMGAVQESNFAGVRGVADVDDAQTGPFSPDVGVPSVNRNGQGFGGHLENC